jgi:hypothetical protein
MDGGGDIKESGMVLMVDGTIVTEGTIQLGVKKEGRKI